MKIKKSKLYFLYPIFFSASMFLLKYYVDGDQIFYIQLYNQYKVTEFFSVMSVAKDLVSSYEPISAYILWIGSKIGISKNIYISFMNVFLLSGIYLLLKKHKAKWYLHILLLSNFYVIVLMTGAERLKIAYIMLVYAALFGGKIGYMLTFFSPLAHLQSSILLISIGLNNFINQIIKKKSLKIKKRNFSFYFFLVIIMIIFYFFLYKGIIDKVQAYLVFKGFLEIWKVLFLLVIGLLISKNRLRIFLMLLPLLIFSFILGDFRVNMISVSIFIYLLLIEDRLKHPLSIILLLYFSIKSYPFILNILKTGNGFNGWLI